MPKKAIAVLSGGPESFNVSFSGKQSDLYNLWLSLHWFSDTEVVQVQYIPVIDGKNRDPVQAAPQGATSFTAFVTLFPDVWTPVSNTETF